MVKLLLNFRVITAFFQVSKFLGIYANLMGGNPNIETTSLKYLHTAVCERNSVIRQIVLTG